MIAPLALLAVHFELSSPYMTVPLMSNASALSLRPATALDADLIASIHAASWQTTYRGLPPDAFLDGEGTRERAADWQAPVNAAGAERLNVVIAERGGEPIGFACVERQ